MDSPPSPNFRSTAGAGDGIPSQQDLSPSPPPHHAAQLTNPTGIADQSPPLLSPSRRRNRKPPSHPLDADEIHGSPAAGTPPVRKRKKGRSLAGTAALGPSGVSPKVRRKLDKRTAGELRKNASLECNFGKESKRIKKFGELSLLPVVDSCPALQNEEDAPEFDSGNLDWIWENISEIIMWKNVAKSTLCFGLGSTFILSSCLSRGSNFSIISAMSQLSLLILAIEFFRDYFRERQQLRCKQNLRLTEADILHATQFILPAVNTTLAKIQEIFSGDPIMTLKVAPVLLFGAKYGHLITFWRLFTTGFFVSFTVPKLYSCYSQQIKHKAESIKCQVQEAWETCPRKKLIAASVATFFWNMFNVKTRIFAGFISLVMLRYQNQQVRLKNKKKKKS